MVVDGGCGGGGGGGGGGGTDVGGCNGVGGDLNRLPPPLLRCLFLVPPGFLLL